MAAPELAEVPRLTAMLRSAVFTTPSSAYTADQLFVERQKALQNASRSSTDQPSQHLLGSGHQKAPRAARDAHAAFTSAVQAALGSEVAGHELAEHVHAAFVALQTKGCTAASLKDVFGQQPSQEHLARLRGASQRLAKERAALKLAPADAASKGSDTSSTSSRTEWRYEPDVPQPATPEPLSPRSAVLRLCEPQHAAPIHAAAAPPADTLFTLDAAGPSTSQSAAPARAHNADVDPDSDDEAMGVRRARASLTWLQGVYCQLTGREPPSRGGDDTVLLLILQVLVNQPDGDAAAGELLDMLGFDHVDDVSRIVSHRPGLLDSFTTAIAKVKALDELNNPTDSGIAMTVKVNTASQKAIQKLERKAQRKGKAGTAAVADIDYARTVGWAALQDTEADYSNQINIGGVNIAIGDSSATKKALPPGTKRETFKNFEEVTVPAVNPGAMLPEERLVDISELEPWAQTAFKGYKTLNRIQSRIFQTGFYTNENMLVCAPTGAGKTNIAMVTVLHELAQHRQADGTIAKDGFKIVYVAPMKALAAEVTRTFGSRLEALGIQVRELTGDMQLSKTELAATQMIVTTPEKWDVITRKGGDVAMASLVRLLIIDEVHLLNDDRGPVIETLISRTLRQVETSQTMIRIVGLSATLPNYQDVAEFLGVSVSTGLFHFGPEFRPVPLAMSFAGVTEKNVMKRNMLMIEIAYDKIADSLRAGHQCMVFVHSRKDTAKTAEQLADAAQAAGDSEMFALDEESPQIALVKKEVQKSRNGQVKTLFERGFGHHHAGMLRSDRNLTERLFSQGHIKVLCCTATLAWGVNLPAHTVIIKGTQVYDSAKGRFTDLGVLDVQQIFGRAGRPQFDTLGEAHILTTHDKLARYLGMLTHSTPIESQFVKNLPDNLNAEVVLGTVSSLREASTWLSYSYLFVRMTRNPLPYGLTLDELAADPELIDHRRTLLTNAAKTLEACKMVRFDQAAGHLYMTDLGRIASHFYIKHESIVVINGALQARMKYEDLFCMMAKCAEFESLKVRDEEVPDLENLLRDHCPLDIREELTSREGKVQVLMQVYISRARVDSFSLVADMNYVGDNAPRLARAVFEIAVRNQWTEVIEKMLTICKVLEKRQWMDSHPLRQFPTLLEEHYVRNLESRRLGIERLVDMSASEIGAMLRAPAAGHKVKDALAYFPQLDVAATVSPITRTVLRVALTVRPQFSWREQAHGQSMRWLLLVEDSDTEAVYHNEIWTLTRKMMQDREHKINFTIPIFEPVSSQYYVKMQAMEWMHAAAQVELGLQEIVLPVQAGTHTDLLDLEPLPKAALANDAFETLYTGRFTHFNPIQTQAFHTLYHTDESVLLGAPTGSGKTVSAELTMLRVFAHHPREKVLYIAPLKALVRERIKDWGAGLCKALGKSMVELTGDYTPDLAALLAADIIICTPEKWDGISRNWQARGYVRMVRLVVMDEIHLLGSDRGPILEVIVSRMRYIAQQTQRAVRFVGLSTALANAHDLASWLGVGPTGLFNFRPAVRPVPLEAHIQGYPGKFYCPRMASMNKPAYAALTTHSPTKPALIFVSSRRQTRLTALDVIAYAAADFQPTRWLRMSEAELADAVSGVKDVNLKHTLQFGIGLHHAGLADRDRTLVERLFCEQRIMVLVATSTLAWGVNTPAHLVIVKGTEYFDAPTKRYVDYPITDVLQMMGRAGRPQFDRTAKAVIMVHEPKKGFYKKFLYEPFPVESALHDQLPDHLNAEVVGGTVASTQEAVHYLTWTYLYRRLPQNPACYGLRGEASDEALSEYLTELVADALESLQIAGCVELAEDGGVAATFAGRICSFYYLRHETLDLLMNHMHQGMDTKHLLLILCSCPEFDEMPVRHNEDKLNTVLSGQVRWPVAANLCDEPHTKANLLFQAHFARLALPIADYVTDTKGALDNSLRLLQAMVDVAAEQGWLSNTLATIRLAQAILQARWHDGPSALCLPHVTDAAAAALAANGYATLLDVVRGARTRRKQLTDELHRHLEASEVAAALGVIDRLPDVDVTVGQLARKQGGADAESGGGGDMLQLPVTLRRRSDTARGGGGKAKARAGQRPRVFAPRFPKIKEEGWVLVLGHEDGDELLALKRLSIGIDAPSHAKLAVPADLASGGQGGLKLWLLSDSYLGLDQQLDVRVQ